MRGHENVAKRPCSAQTGWSKTTQTRIPKHFGESTTPSAPSEDASRYFLDVASTPPLQGGDCCLSKRINQFVHTLDDAYQASFRFLQKQWRPREAT
jgi:hypothetical protein